MDKHHQKIMTHNYSKSQAGAHSRLVTGEKVQSPDYFVDVEWLNQAINSNQPNLVVVDVTRGQGNYPLDVNRVAEDYQKGHIPTAIHLNTDELGGFKEYFLEDSTILDVFLSKGIHSNSIVVFYSIYARDILYIASRMAFAAYYLGVDQVKILDGGLQAWQRAGYPLETGTNTPQPIDYFGKETPVRKSLLVSKPDDLIQAREENPKLKLVSVRTWNEYIGLNEGHAWNKGSGDICGSLYAGDELLANVNGEIANPDIYVDGWREWGILPEDDIILYCGTSWRSSTMFFLMKELGYQHLRLYDGSWYKWYLAHEANPSRYPIQQGDPRDKAEFRIINS